MLCKIQQVFNLFQRILTLTYFVCLSVKVIVAEYEFIIVLVILKDFISRIFFSIICCLQQFKYSVTKVNSIIHLGEEHVFFMHLKWSLTLEVVYSLWQRPCFLSGFVQTCELKIDFIVKETLIFTKAEIYVKLEF